MSDLPSGKGPYINYVTHLGGKGGGNWVYLSLHPNAGGGFYIRDSSLIWKNTVSALYYCILLKKAFY